MTHTVRGVDDSARTTSSAMNFSETMMTVGEVSRLLGVSVRTLHYWDETGLAHPSQRSDAGYRDGHHAHPAGSRLPADRHESG